jgi:hypothetical protein
VRRDFAKLLFERPKSNRTWAKKTPRPLAIQLDADGALAKLQAYRRARQKQDGRRYTPLVRYLIRQVGRPWSQVRFAALAHVEIDCWRDGRWIRSTATGRPVEGLYAHPRSGLLRRTPDRPRKKQQNA